VNQRQRTNPPPFSKEHKLQEAAAQQQSGILLDGDEGGSKSKSKAKGIENG